MTNKAPKRILCVHQGVELYGSDRMFLLSVKAFRQAFPKAHIAVHLPKDGKLVEHLKPFADAFILGRMSVLRRSDFRKKKWKNVFLLPFNAIYAWFNAMRHDLVYVNTVTVASYVTILPLVPKKKIIHAHEFSHGISQFFLSLFLRLSGAMLIVNSRATTQAFPAVKKKYVVWNGVPKKLVPKIPGDGTLRILCSGRINDWKGQGLLLDALHELKTDGNVKFSLDIVGDVFDDENHHMEALKQKIKDHELEPFVTLHGFHDDPSHFYHTADLLVVPSLKPEPFGLVAVEAMRAAVAVVAADHGGLQEIVVANETGYLFAPGNAKLLAEMIRKYMVHPDLVTKHGVAGRKVFEEKFMESRYQSDFIKTMTGV